MVAAPSASLEPPFGVAIPLRERVPEYHELAGWLLERGFCPIAIRFNIDSANHHSSGALHMHANAINIIPINSFAPASEFITSNRDESTLISSDAAPCFEGMVGSSEPLRRVLAQVSKVAPTDATVLILGETGTGKELVARAIHNRSRRSSRPFVRLNCGAIEPSLLISELFGHERGAFTGALQRRLGRFECANGGTIFLDEIGELPRNAQVALLRVLQEREFERLGGTQTISTDVRVLAATNRDLNSAASEGTFRQDLLFRLNVFPIRLPALRERVDDIPLLAEYLIYRSACNLGKQISSISGRTLDLFRAYEWPGNIRELQNVIERAVITCDGEQFSVDESWLKLRQDRISSLPLATDLEEREREMIENALEECRGLVAGPRGAAARLKIARQTLDSKIKKLGINRYNFKKHNARPTILKAR
jgi:formate hydrogenlyase transcriptional activator